jgi:hypothetical protein
MHAERRHHATCEHNFEADETEFLIAMDRFKQRSGKNFPTWSDTLSVLKSLGYAKRATAMTEWDAALAV